MTFTNMIWVLLVAMPFLPLSAFGASAQEECSLATLKGTYGGFQQGTVVAQLPGFPPPPLPSAKSVAVTYDGMGHFNFKFTENLNGVVNSGTGTGTYSVQRDCSYSDEFLFSDGTSAHFAGSIGGAGLSLRIDSVSIDPSIVSSGTMKKVPKEECSLATLQGTFRGITEGTVVSLPGFPVPPPFPAAMIQAVTYDGAGKVSGHAIVNFGGVVFPGNPAGTYTVNPDCTYSDSFAHVGTITRTGIMQEVDYIFVNSNVAVGIIKR